MILLLPTVAVIATTDVTAKDVPVDFSEEMMTAVL